MKKRPGLAHFYKKYFDSRLKEGLTWFFWRFQLAGETEAEFSEDGDWHGPGHGHVEAHVSPRRSQDHGRDQEGSRIRSSTPG